MAGATNMVAAPDGSTPTVTAPDRSSPGLVVSEDLSAEVLAQLLLVLGAASPGGLSGVGSEQALRVVEAVESVKAWADSVSLEATAVMVGEFEKDCVHLAPQRPTARGWQLFFRHCRSAAAREIQVATGLPITQCQRRVWLTACEPQRVGPIREGLRLGRVTLARALALAEGTAHLDAFTAAAIASRVLAPLTGPDGVPLPGVAPLSEATFRARLRRQLVLHHGLVGEAERTYEEAVKARRLSAEPQHDGTAMMVLTGDGPRIAAALGRVDKIARRLRNGGDPRTLDQLRADVATDLLLRGWVPGDPGFTRLGEAPVATVQLIVSLPTILGMDKGVAVIPGWGCVSAQAARDLALTAGSIWTRVVTDPLTGRAIEATATTYTVPAGMGRQVQARDGVCRAPGCEIPAERCDLDHSIEWEPGGAGGPTAETNLTAVHRGHHNLKTGGFWDSDQSPDGTLTWTTTTGRKVRTYPYVYDHPDNLPVATSQLEAHYGRRLAPILNPDLPPPGRPSIFDELSWAQTLAPAHTDTDPATGQPPPHTWATTRRSQATTPNNQASTAARDNQAPAAASTAVTGDDEGPPPF